ncbi:unnamed protein product [Meganyctiphanes norvegica]|uniref:ShKT domain-containing protein n=1 Tax=Meganyctiphanes norvegica TaxID=48144 RepID=A0AAV2RV76_MEGNR
MLLIRAVTVASVLMLQFNGLNAKPQTSPSSECMDVLETSTCNVFLEKGHCPEHGSSSCRKTCKFCTPQEDDPAFCAVLDATSQCGFPEIASVCRILCSASTTTTAPPTTTTTTTAQPTTPTTTSSIPLTGPNMYKAACRGDTDFVRRALASGINADWRNCGEPGLPETGLWCDTSLFPASRNNHPQIVRALLEAGADVNYSSSQNNGRTAIFVAIGNTEVVKILLDAGANVNLGLFRSGTTPLHMAVGGGHVEEAVLLLKKGANPNAEGRYGTPYENARKSGNDELADIMASYN